MKLEIRAAPFIKTPDASSCIETSDPRGLWARRQLLMALTSSGLLAACGSGGGSGGDSGGSTSAPTLVIDSNVAGTATTTFQLSFQFSDAVSGFAVDRFLVTNGSVVAGSFAAVSAREYTVLISPRSNSSGAVEITVFASAFANAAGTAQSTGTYRFSQAFDTTVTEPWLRYTDDATGVFVSAPLTLTMTFNVDVGTSFDLDKLFVLGATPSAFTKVSATVYTLRLTPEAGARLMSVELPAGAVTANVVNGIPNRTSWRWDRLVAQ